MKRRQAIINIVTCITLLLLTGCSQKTLTVHSYGQEVTNISDENVNLLPTGVVDFTLNPGDVLRLEATPTKEASHLFLLERGDSIRLSFYYAGNEYRIMTGDRISIFVQNDSPFNQEITVRMDGRITIPRVGDIMAKGLTPAELATLLSRKLKRTIKDATITVSILQSNMDPFTLMTGEYFILPDGTISLPILGIFEAQGLSIDSLSKLISASTFDKFNNKFRVSVSAQSHAIEQLQVYDKVLTVTPAGDFILPHIGNINVKGKTLLQVREEVQHRLQNYFHNPIDISLGLVSGVNNSVYVSGEVRFPGIYPLMANMTTLKVLSLAGGVTPLGDLDEVVLIHYTSADALTVYKTSLTEVFNQSSHLYDLPLSPQDIVFVPKTGIAEANQFIDQYINKMLPFDRGVTYNFNEIR